MSGTSSSWRRPVCKRKYARHEEQPKSRRLRSTRNPSAVSPLTCRRRTSSSHGIHAGGTQFLYIGDGLLIVLEYSGGSDHFACPPAPPSAPLRIFFCHRTPILWAHFCPAGGDGLLDGRGQFLRLHHGEAFL